MAEIKKCNCGRSVKLDDPMTNQCDRCGAFYNGFGQRLSPPRFWGEETGEQFDNRGQQAPTSPGEDD